MASIFPASLDILGDGGVQFTDNVRAASGGRIDIKFFDPGKLVPGLEIFDAVSKGAVDAGWASAGFWIGKLPSAALFSSIPFGPDTTEYMSWMFAGGGEALYQGLYAQHNVHVEPCALIPPEASGWFRQPITSPDQLNGLKMRFFGLGGKAMQKLGVSVQLLAPGDIFPALERGVLDATEFSMPNTDIKFGFNRIAKHYYFPGWHQQASWGEFMINTGRWEEMSAADKMIVQLACRANIVRSISQGEAAQAPVLEQFKREGVELHYWSKPMLETFRKASAEVMAQEASNDAYFAKTWESVQAFRGSYQDWASLSRLPKKAYGE
jgi:TRAP-type mannitol/chloroaromatic compound transport system substrate-binding protein